MAITGTTNLDSLTLSGNLIVAGTTEFAGGETVTGPETVTGSLTVGAAASFGSNITITGALTSGAATLSGTCVIGTTGVAHGHTINGNTVDMLGASSTAAGVNNTFHVFNANNSSSTSNARFRARVGGSSGGDAYSTYEIASGSAWSIGLDNSDSDALVVTNATTLDGSNLLKINAGGATTITTGLTVGSNTVNTGTVTCSRIIAGNGTTVAPAHTFGDTTAGFWSPGNDQVNLALDGTEIIETTATSVKVNQPFRVATTGAMRVDTTLVTTVGSAGTATALPAVPVTYLPVLLGTVSYKIAIYNA